MQLSKNFTLEELTRSSTAEANGIDNTPNEQHVENLRKLCEFVLQPVRDAWGVPLRINSGYRSPALNAILVRTNGASKTSQHMLGQAADIHCTSLQNAISLAACIIDNAVTYDQLIIETSLNTASLSPSKGGKTSSPQKVWIHVSFAEGKNRQNVFFQQTKFL